MLEKAPSVYNFWSLGEKYWANAPGHAPIELVGLTISTSTISSKNSNSDRSRHGLRTSNLARCSLAVPQYQELVQLVSGILGEN